MIRNASDFNRFFQSEIAPKYEEKVLETQRQIQKLKTYSFLPGIILVVLFFLIWNLLGAVAFIIGIGALVVTAVAIWFLFPNVRAFFHQFNENLQTKQKVLDDVFAAVIPGMRYDESAAISPEEFMSYGFVDTNRIDRFFPTDSFTGSFKGMPFRFTEVRISEAIKRGDSTHYRPVFNGSIVVLDLQVPSDFHLIAARKQLEENANSFNLFENGPDLSDISLGNVYFDEHYSVSSNDSFKTRKVFPPAKLANTASVFEGLDENISFGVYQGQLVLLIHNSHNLFELFNGTDFSPESLWEDLVKMVRYINLFEKFNVDKDSI